MESALLQTTYNNLSMLGVTFLHMTDKGYIQKASESFWASVGLAPPTELTDKYNFVDLVAMQDKNKVMETLLTNASRKDSPFHFTANLTAPDETHILCRLSGFNPSAESGAGSC